MPSRSSLPAVQTLPAKLLRPELAEDLYKPGVGQGKRGGCVGDDGVGLLSVKVRVPPLAVVQDQRGTSETSSTGQGDFAPGRQGLSAVTSWRR